LCSRGVSQLTDPDVDACRGLGEEARPSVRELIDPGVDVCHGSGEGVSSVVRELTDPGAGVRCGFEMVSLGDGCDRARGS